MKTTDNIHRRGWTLVELLVLVSVVAVLAAVIVSVVSASKKRSYRARAVEKLRTLGSAFVSYTTDKNGLLPWEDSPGQDDWMAMANPENRDVWYQALPSLIGSTSAEQLAAKPALFYEDSHPLYLPGAPYPSSDKKLSEPYFAIAMNSRLQRKNEDGTKVRGSMSMIQVPSQTIIFLERGMPGDEKSNHMQRGFDASPKANALAFAARYNGQGLLICADGHVESRSVSDLISASGEIIVPQTGIVWTFDPDDNPN